LKCKATLQMWSTQVKKISDLATWQPLKADQNFCKMIKRILTRGLKRKSVQLFTKIMTDFLALISSVIYHGAIIIFRCQIKKWTFFFRLQQKVENKNIKVRRRQNVCRPSSGCNKQWQYVFSKNFEHKFLHSQILF
jgi:hypothetical protein